MALPAFNSGNTSLSINQIHQEAGGNSFTEVSLNDSDIRGLTAASDQTINSSSQTEISFRNLFGASSILWEFTINPGEAKTSSINNDASTLGKQTTSFERIGYSSYDNSSRYYTLGASLTIIPYGTTSDSTVDFYSYGSGNAALKALVWTNLLNGVLTLDIEGHHSNSGWTTIEVNGTTFNRTSATYSQDYEGTLSTPDTNKPITRWTWVTYNDFITGATTAAKNATCPFDLSPSSPQNLTGFGPASGSVTIKFQ